MINRFLRFDTDTKKLYNVNVDFFIWRTVTKMLKVDFHSHILPGMDDGAKNTDESVRMLKKLADDGVDTVVLTPHFYRRDENIKSFLARREKSYNELCKAVKSMEKCPELRLGAEVYYYPSLSSDPDFHKLVIEGTDYVLLELPFERFYHNFFSGYNKFVSDCEQKIILAHIERYMDFGNTEEEFGTILNFGKAVCQMNCNPIARVGLFSGNKIMKLIKSGIISVIGTDTHNLDSRPPRFGKAEKKIISKLGKDEFSRLCHNSRLILENEPINRIR